ncbi:MAG: cyanophycinase [Bacteroidia bacterium]|nr:cyanophycinase [Bacteroidia bacterium]
MNIPKGKLISIGGNEDKGSDPERGIQNRNNLNFFELQILQRIKDEMNNPNPHIEVITTASNIPLEVGENYLDAFGKLNVKDVQVMHIRNREDTQNPEFIERIKKADGVLFTGGNQLRLSMIFGGTDILNILHERYLNEPFVIAGTSAGAMAMSNTMIYEGSSAEALLKGQVKITTGLAFMKDVIIDSHFVKRGRFGRLAQAVAANPQCIGIGLGEDTGVLVTEGNKLEAIGSGLVLIFDGHSIRHTNIADIQDGNPISIENLIVHVMCKGNHYHLKQRKFFPHLNSVMA